MATIQKVSIKTRKTPTQDTKVTGLKEGEVRILSIRQSSDPNKIMVHLVQGVPSRNLNITAELNEGDDRFRQGASQRHAWVAVSRQSAGKIGITEEMLAKLDAVSGNGEIVEFEGFINPTMKLSSGKIVKLTIVQKDSIVPSTYQSEDQWGRCKKLPATKSNPERYFIHQDSEGNYHFIFSNKSLAVEGSDNDIILESFGNKLYTREEVEQLGTSSSKATSADILTR